MRIQQVVLVLVVSVSLVALSARTARSQVSDPFGGNATEDPFGLPSAIAKSPKSPPSVPKQQPAGQAPDKNVVHVVTVGESETDQRIHMALRDETSNNFVDTPLMDAVRSISKLHDIPMLVDARALEESGLTVDTPVSIALHRVSLRSFLRLMLRDLDLTYLVKDEVMQITTVEAAEQSLETRMYDLPKLLSSKTDKVLAALQSAVVPNTWSSVGGASTANSIDHVLIVSTTSDVHQDVFDFLDTLIRMHEKK